jgi:uncharacterized protein
MDVTVQHNERLGRYEALVDGRLVGQADYRIEDGRMVMFHTEVDRRLGGQGIAGQMVESALRDARDQGLDVVPACSYVADYIERNPQHAELVAAR